MTQGSPPAGRLALLLTVVCLGASPGVALAQQTSGTGSPVQSGTQSGTSGSGNGSQSGPVDNEQSNTQHGSGGQVQQNATNQNCVAGRDCVNNNITNQNQVANNVAPSAPSGHVVTRAAPRAVTTTSAPTVAPRRFEQVAPAHRVASVAQVGLARTGADLPLLFLIGGLLLAGGGGVLAVQRYGWLTRLRRSVI